MPLQSKPEDKPAAVCFHASRQEDALAITVTAVASDHPLPYRILGGAPRFSDRDAFKAKVVEVGMSPAVAEDQGRSFNATARQLRELGFSVETLDNPAG